MHLTVDAVREGTFLCQHDFTAEKCGLNADLPQTRHFRYEVRVRPMKLDRYGFAIDNREIARYFATTFRDPSQKFVSCERMALDAARHFQERLEETGQGCERIEVKIWGFPEVHAHVVLTGEAGDFVADSGDVYGALSQRR